MDVLFLFMLKKPGLFEVTTGLVNHIINGCADLCFGQVWVATLGWHHAAIGAGITFDCVFH